MTQHEEAILLTNYANFLVTSFQMIKKVSRRAGKF